MQLLVIIILILVNAFFAAAEIAFISLNDAKIEVMANDGDKKAKKIRKILKKPSKFLATIQVGVTLAGFLSSAFASETFANDLAPIFNNWIPQLSINAWHTIAIILITLVLSIFTLIFGELVPKRLAMKYSEKIAFGTVGIIHFVAVITAPIVKFLTVMTNLVSKLFGVSESDEETVSEEEIRMMIDVGEERGTIDEDESYMINNVFEFDDKQVSEIMIPRTKIYAWNMNLNVSEAMDRLSEDFKYSRVPVYEKTIDNIRGVVYLKDILLTVKNDHVKLKSIMKDIYQVPETKPIDELFDELRQNRKQIAIVVDEYGGTSGLVTMEDILEEIVGDIYDEYDEPESYYEKIDDNNYTLSGSLAIYDVEEVMDIEIPEGDYDTLSGYLITQIGKIPTKEDVGTIVDSPEATFEIQEIAKKHIIKVKGTVKEKPKDDEEEKEKHRYWHKDKEESDE